MSPGTLLQEAGWALELVQKVVKNLAPSGFRSRNCPALSESLYPPRYLSRCNYGVKLQCAETDGSLLCLELSGTPLHWLTLIPKYML